MRIQNTELPFCTNKDPSEYYVDKVTEYIKKMFRKTKSSGKYNKGTRTSPSKQQKEKNMAM